jgi:tetratricopeptide (TPR) repeat protein
MELKEKITQLFERAYRIEIDFVNALHEDKRVEIGAKDHWSAKDVLAHCAYWKTHHAKNIIAVSEGETPIRAEDFTQANEEVFEKHRSLSWDEVLALVEEGYRNMINILDLDILADLYKPDVLPWQDGRPIWREIVGNGYTHSVFHIASLYTEFGDIQSAREINEEMITTLGELDDDPVWVGTLRYNLACHYALCGEEEMAVKTLRESLTLNPSLLEWSKEDPDFESIRETSSYKNIYAELAS